MEFLKKYSRHILKFAVLPLAIGGGMDISAGDFDDIVNMVMDNDKSLALARVEANSAIAAVRATNTLSDPEAEFEFLASGSGDKKYNFSVTQGFDWPGVYSARRRQAELEREGLEYGYDIRYAEQRSKVRGLLTDIVASNKIISQMTSAVEGYERLLAVLEKGYSNGNVSILDLNKIRIESADFRLKLAEAENRRDDLLSELTSNMNSAAGLEERCKTISEFPLLALKPMEDYIADAKANSPELKLARNQNQVAAAKGDVTAKSLLPGFSAGYSLSHEDGMLYNGFNVGVSLPLWRAGKERKAAASSTMAAKLAEETAEIQLQKSIEASYRRAVNLKATIAEYGASLTASDNEALLRKAYNSGVITLTEFVNDINYYVEAWNKYVELQREYYNILLELGRYDRDL